MSDIKEKSEQLKLEVMKALLIRAADALEKHSISLNTPIPELIAELRKAAG